MTETLIVYCSCPDTACAQGLAQHLVQQRLAACVTVLPNVHSYYWWQQQVQEATEVMLLIKIPASRYSELEEVIRQQHPYQLPELLAVPVSHGLPDYIKWVNNNEQ